MRWQTGEANTNRNAQIVVPGFYTGKVQFADENPKYNKIKVTLDTDDGTRIKFNIGQKHGNAALEAIGREGNQLEANDLVGQRITVKLDQYCPDPESEPDKIYNTLQEIHAATEEDTNGTEGKIGEDDIPL